MEILFLSDSGSSSDEDIPRNRRYVNRSNVFDELGESEFRARFRLLKINVLNLVELVDPFLYPRKKSTRHAVSTMDQVLITMRYVLTIDRNFTTS